MKQIYICLAALASMTGYSQEKDNNKIPTLFTLAVKEAQGWDTYKPGTPDFSFYNRNYRLFQYDNLTSDILDRRMNMLYVDNDRLYSNTYVPIVLQQHYSNLAVDAFYRTEKMYAQPDKVPGSK